MNSPPLRRVGSNGTIEAGQEKGIQYNMDRFRDFVGRRCCSCVHSMPSIVLIISVCLLVALLLAIVPALFILSSAVSSEAQAIVTPGADFPPMRVSHLLPAADPVQHEGFDIEHRAMDSDEDDDSVTHANETADVVRGMSAKALFPPNIDLCTGFGFACTHKPSHVISTALRCDGTRDCEDASDEEFCKECQSSLFCRVSNESKLKICLNAGMLCDGVRHCVNGEDEVEFCRGDNETCTDENYSCKDSLVCIPKALRCDGITDCRQHDDEESCTEETCSHGAKFCKSTSKCIAASQLCDGVSNCEDGSDEADCNCRSCSGSDKAMCKDKTCIARSKVCDGFADCADGTDEEGCPGSCGISPEQVDLVKCEDGLKYPALEACSGKLRQCQNSCSGKCNKLHGFQCADKKCIDRRLVCDGIKDCSAGEDEANCDCDASNMFKCLNSRKCIPSSQRCDSVWDCEDGSDERQCEQCPSDSTRCDGLCLPAISRCNGIVECSDGSDEKDCSCHECLGLHSNTYMCENKERCFHRDQVCAPYSLCPNATKSDRVFCAARALPGLVI